MERRMIGICKGKASRSELCTIGKGRSKRQGKEEEKEKIRNKNSHTEEEKSKWQNRAE